MAERLPRYRPLGARIPGVPSVNYVQTGQAQARVFDTLANSLDKMAEFAYERDKVRTIREAEKYAFDNPLTEGQINAALKKGGIDESDINVDRDTVFGATVLATTGKILAADLDGEYRKSVGTWQKIIESPDWNPEDPETGMAAIASELRGMEDGYSDLIADIDPGEAASFKAGVASLGGAVYKTALEVSNKKARLAKRMSTQQQVDDFSSNARALIQAHAGDDVTLNQQLDILANNLRSSLFATGDIEFAEAEAGKIADAINQARIDVLSGFGSSDEFAMTGVERSNKMRKGDFGRYSDIWNKMSAAEKAQVRQNIRTEVNARETADSNQRSEGDRIAGRQVGRIGEALRDPELTPQRREQLITDLYTIAQVSSGRVISVTTIRALEKDLDEGAVSNPAGNLLLRQAIARGEVTQENFDEKRAEFGVIAKDAIPLFEDLLTTDRQSASDVLKIAKSTAGVYSEVTDVSDEKATQIDSFLRRVEARHIDQVSEWERGGEVGPRPRRLDAAVQVEAEFIANGYTQDIKTRVDKVNENLKNFTSFEFTEFTTEQQIDELTFEGLDETKANRLKNEIKRALQLIQQAREARARFF